ncbi:MAG: ABC transporter permease [Acidobacteriota bacterium]
MTEAPQTAIEPDSGRPPLSGPIGWVIAWRFLRGRRSRLLDGTARVALAATALGVLAMVIAMALMTGYREDLRRKLIEGNAPVMVQSLLPGRGSPPPEALQALESLPGVLAVGRVAFAQGTLSAAGPVPQAEGSGDANFDGNGRRQGVEVTLRGIDPGGGQLAATAEQLEIGSDGAAGAVLGSELARRLLVSEGDRLRLVVLGFENGRPRFRYHSLRVTDTFTVGYAEFDASWVLVAREILPSTGGSVDLWEVTLEDPALSGPVVERAKEVLGPDFLVSDWRHLNRDLFTALEGQQRALFLVLGLIVLVSTFNVASTLVVLVRDRMRQLGVLGALGLPKAGLRTIFLAYGSVLGTVGVFLGVLVGTVVCWVLTRWELIRFDPEVANIYFISSVPFRVRPSDLLAIIVFALGVNLLACALPAWRAAKIDPADALRYE